MPAHWTIEYEMSTSDALPSDRQPAQEERGEGEILADLDQLTQEPGFIYTFCMMVWQALWMTTEEVPDIDWHGRPNNKELSLLLGFLAKRPLELEYVPIREKAENQVIRASELLNELHVWCGIPTFDTSGKAGDNLQEQFDDFTKAYEEWMQSGRGMVEPIFYGNEGAHIFQYLEMASKRYVADEDWIRQNLGTGFDTITEIAGVLERVSRGRLQQVDLWSTHEQICRAVLDAMSFHPDDVPEVGRHDLDKFLDRFSCVPGCVNQDFNSMGGYNQMHSHPVIKLGDGRFCVPLLPNLAQSIYESPYYWMLADEAYRDAAFNNRGDATEIITRDLLVPIFGQSRVHRGVKVKKGRDDVTDLDVLAISGNKALVVQCKSKKLTLIARAGDGQALRKDFIQAVQDAYDQAFKGREALLQGGCTFTDADGTPVKLPTEIDDVYIVCVTGDHYPAVITQACIHLDRKAEDPHPVLMSVFDLDVVSFYLSDRFEFLYYIRQRVDHAVHFIADSEMTLLGFHLKRKLFPQDNADGMLIDASYSQLADANFLVARGNWQASEADDRLFHEWKNDAFDQLLADVKTVANTQLRPGVATEDVVLHLYDFAGEAADYLIKTAENQKLATLRDGQRHDVRVPIPAHKKGATFVSFPRPQHSIERELFTRDLRAIALAHK